MPLDDAQYRSLGANEHGSLGIILSGRPLHALDRFSFADILAFSQRLHEDLRGSRVIGLYANATDRNLTRVVIHDDPPRCMVRVVGSGVRYTTMLHSLHSRYGEASNLTDLFQKNVDELSYGELRLDICAGPDESSQGLLRLRLFHRAGPYTGVHIEYLEAGKHADCMRKCKAAGA